MYPRYGINYRKSSIQKCHAQSTDSNLRMYNFCMVKRIKNIIVVLVLLIISQASQGQTIEVKAISPGVVRIASAYELIDAVNSYRVQHGLPVYNINSILMGTAQSQADYRASTGTVTHTGPGGISFPDRLIAAGYTFVFRSENILSTSSDASGWSLVTSSAWADEDHQHTMLSPDLKDIGAGVALDGSRGYYVIDTGGSGSSGGSGGTIAPAGTIISGSTPSYTINTSATPVIVTPNTPKPDGSVVHVVQPGETLWSIAIAYKTTIDELKAYNRLAEDNIYPGNTLMIVLPKPTSTPTQTPTSTAYPTPTSFIFWTVTSSPQPAPSPIPASPASGRNSATIVGVIIASALLFGGVITAASAKKRRRE